MDIRYMLKTLELAHFEIDFNWPAGFK